MWPQLSYNGFEVSDPTDQAKGAQNSSISKSPLPSLSNFLKSFGMSSGPTGRRVVRKKNTEGAQRKTKRPVVRGFVVFGVTFVGCQIWKKHALGTICWLKSRRLLLLKDKRNQIPRLKKPTKKWQGQQNSLDLWLKHGNEWLISSQPPRNDEGIKSRVYPIIFSVFYTVKPLFEVHLERGYIPWNSHKDQNPRKEFSIPTIHFQVRAVNFTEGKRSLKHHHCPLIRPAISSEVVFQVLWLLISWFGIFRIPILPVCDYFEICLRGDSASSLLKKSHP